MCEEDFIMIGKNVARIRKESGFTQAELAGKIGIKRTLMTDYEIGRIRIPSDIIVKISKTLKVSADELLGLVKTQRKLPSLKIMKRFYEIEKLSEVEQKALLKNIDMFLKGAKK